MRWSMWEWILETFVVFNVFFYIEIVVLKRKSSTYLEIQIEHKPAKQEDASVLFCDVTRCYNQKMAADTVAWNSHSFHSCHMFIFSHSKLTTLPFVLFNELTT